MNSQFSTHKLGEVADIIAGGDKPKIFSINKNDLNHVPVFANAEKNNGLLGYTDTARIIEPSVTVAARGSNVGFVAVRKEPFFPVVRLLTLIPNKERLDVDYLFYNLKQNRQNGTGSGQPQITIPDISSKIISLPSILTQQKVAKVLSSLEAKIELNNRINAELEAMAKTLYDYWFVQSDFPDGNGNPYKTSGGKMVYNSALKRKIPEGWEVTTVGKISKTELGGTPSTAVDEYWQDADIPWLSSAETASFPVITSEQKITQAGIDNSAATLLPKGTVVISIVRYIRPSILGIDAATNQSVVGIRECNRLKSSFIYPYFCSEVPRLMGLRTGAQQPHINKGVIEDSPIVIPSEKVLTGYYKIAEPIFKEIMNLAFQSHELVCIRDWLLPMLMNGQVTVSSSAQSKTAEA